MDASDKQRWDELVGELRDAGIGRGELVELLEAASWALRPIRRDQCGTHMDLSDEYMTELAGKLATYMNPEGE